MDIWLGLLLSAFLSATLLPGSSEAHAVYLSHQGLPLFMIVLVASIGNTLGGLFNFILGRIGGGFLRSKIIGFSRKRLWQARILFNKYGSVLLFFSFLPVIGDPLTAVAGILKYPVIKFVIIVFLGKLSRYFLLIYILGKDGLFF